MTLKDLAPQLDPTKLIRVEVEDPELPYQLIYVNIEFALREIPEVEVRDFETMPWTHVVYVYPFEKREKTI